MKYNFNISMHKQTLVTAYSSNPEEKLLCYAQEDQSDDYHLLENTFLPGQIRGWAHASKVSFSHSNRESPNIVIRKRSLSTKRRTSSSNTSSDTEESKDVLKEKLNKYLGTIEDLPGSQTPTSFEPKPTSHNFLTTTIDLPSRDYVQGHQLKGFHRKFNLKRSQNHNNRTSLDPRSLTLQKKAGLPAQSGISSFRLKGQKRVAVVGYPMNVGFPSEQEESMLQSKLHSYLQAHLKLRED